MAEVEVQYVSDGQGNLQSVIVPINLWREILAEKETAYLLGSEAMKARLLRAIQRQEGIPFEDALAQLGI
jgi:hypothetical protein